MNERRPVQLLVFEGNPPSLWHEAQRILRRQGETFFLCMLAPDENPEPVKSTWLFSIQPTYPQLNLFIIYASRNTTFDTIARFANELSEQRHAELDVLFLSDNPGWRDSRRLAAKLRALQSRLDKIAPGCLVRRV